MKSYAIVVLVVATVFGHVNARLSSGILVTADINNEVGHECPHKAVPDTIFTVPFIMLNKVHECYKPSPAFLRKVTSAPDTEAYRRIFESACSNVPSVKTCIAAMSADADACLNDAERKLWTATLDFLDTCIAATCDDDSEVAAMFGEEFKVMTVGSKMRVMSCMYATTAQTLYDRETDLSAYTLRKYRAIKSGKKCILNVAKHGQTTANQFEHFMEKLITNMKCLTPGANEIVPCNTLEADDAIDDFVN